MHRLGIAFMLVLAVLCQTIGMQAAAAIAVDPAHAALHMQDTAHHHHDDGGVHVDDSDESLAHVAVDHLTCCSPALVASVQLAFACPTEQASAPPPDSFIQGPSLDGLLRPPRFLS
jgi:hypothetical protein